MFIVIFEFSCNFQQKSSICKSNQVKREYMPEKYDALNALFVGIPEAATGWVLEEKVFLEICEIHRKTPVPESFFW